MKRARVPLNDLQRLHAPLLPALRAAMDRVLVSGRFVLGPEVEAFEQEAARYLGVRHAVGISSGSDALVVALAALGIGRGDVVVTTAFSFFATVEAVLRVGALPRFVDVEPGTLNLDADQLDEALSRGARAVLPVHVFGRPLRMDAVSSIAERHRVPVVEDAAQAFGAVSCERRVGTASAFGCFSFFPGKGLGALGDGGLVVTDDDELAARACRLRQHGTAAPHEHQEVGGNYRLDALQAAILRVKLPLVDGWLAERRAHGARYDQELAGLPGIHLLPPDPGSACSVYAIRVLRRRRDVVRARLEHLGVETAVYYPRPMYAQLALRHVPVNAGAFPEAERACQEVLALPLFPGMTSEELAHVVASVHESLR